MRRDTLEIVYATLRDLIFSFPKLSRPPRIVYDYTPTRIVEGDFPAVGIRYIHTSHEKLLDKQEEYCRTERDGAVYAWFERGRFDYSCQIGLFASASESVANPVPFLRSWREHVEEVIIDRVRFATVADPVAGEQIMIRTTGDPFEQNGKLLYSVKLTLEVKGKVLHAVETTLQVPPPKKRNWVIASVDPIH